MATVVTAKDVVNEAIQLYGGDQALIKAGSPPLFDSSKTGLVAGAVYASVVATVGRQFGWDFARKRDALAVSGNVAPFPWAFEYLYPADCIHVWQVAPASLIDPNDPQPVSWEVGNANVGGTQTKVIRANLAAAQIVYNSNPNENLWDPLFRQAVVRLLASELSMGVAGKPDTAEGLLQSGSAFESIGEQRGET